MRMLVALLLSGCAHSYDWTRPQEISQTTVAWHQSDDYHAICFDKLDGQRIGMGACAVWTDKHCDIWTPLAPEESILGHELKHCFGYTHD